MAVKSYRKKKEVVRGKTTSPKKGTAAAKRATSRAKPTKKAPYRAGKKGVARKAKKPVAKKAVSKTAPAPKAKALPKAKGVGQVAKTAPAPKGKMVFNPAGGVKPMAKAATSATKPANTGMVAKPGGGIRPMSTAPKAASAATKASKAIKAPKGVGGTAKAASGVAKAGKMGKLAKAGKLAKGYASFEAVAAPVRGALGRKSADVPLTGERADFRGDEEKYASVAAGREIPTENLSIGKMFYGDKPTKFGGLLGGLEKAGRSLSSMTEAPKLLWQGVGDALNYALTGDPKFIGKTQMEEDKLNAFQKVMKGISRPISVFDDKNVRYTDTGMATDIRGFQESDIAKGIRGVDEEREFQIQRLVDGGYLDKIQQQLESPVDQADYDEALQMMSNPMVKEAMRRKAASGEVIDAEGQPFEFGVAGVADDRAAFDEGAGAVMAGDLGEDPDAVDLLPEEVLLREGEYVGFATDPRTGKPMRIRSGRSPRKGGISRERRQELVTGRADVEDFEARRRVGKRRKMAEEASRVEAASRKKAKGVGKEKTAASGTKEGTKKTRGRRRKTWDQAQRAIEKRRRNKTRKQREDLILKRAETTRDTGVKRKAAEIRRRRRMEQKSKGVGGASSVQAQRQANREANRQLKRDIAKIENQFKGYSGGLSPAQNQARSYAQQFKEYVNMLPEDSQERLEAAQQYLKLLESMGIKTKTTKE